jgi:hypothetical protein
MVLGALASLARAAAIAVSLWLVLLLAWLVRERVSYAFELNWMEGETVEHVERLLRGAPIYAAPTAEFVAFIYNPLFYYVSAPLVRLCSSGLVAVRAVSIASTAGSLFLVFAFVRRETRAGAAAVVAAGTFAGTYPVSRAWMDIGRVDSLCVFLCLAALYAAGRSDTRRDFTLAVLLSWLAFATKQSALVVVLFVAAWALRRRGRSALGDVLPISIAFVLALAALNVSTGGWYGYYAFLLPSGHPLDFGVTRGFLWTELARPLPIALAFAAYAAAVPGGTNRGSSRWYAVLAAATLILMSYASRVHTGSWVNDDIPAHAGVAILFGIGVHAVATRRSWGGAVGFGAAAVQLVLLSYSPAPWMARASDATEPERLMVEVARHPGMVLAMHQSHLLRKLGKGSTAHAMAVFDVLRSSRDTRGARAALVADLARAFAARRYSAVILDTWYPLTDLVEKSYQLDRARSLPTFRVYAPADPAR